MPPENNESAPPSPTIVTEELNDSCADSPLGVVLGVDPGNELVALPTGVSGTFQFHWSTGETETTHSSHSIIAPGPGVYSVLVIDENNCFAIGTATIQDGCEDSDLSVTATYSSGYLTFSATGGEQPYNSISWSPQTGEDWQSISAFGEYFLPVMEIDNPTPGTYTLTVIDGNDCSAAATMIVN